MTRNVFAFTVLTMVLLVCGCSGDGLELVAVKGQVSYQGEPLEKAEIRFVPAAGTKAPGRSAMVRDGKYEASGRGALAVGTYRVEISAYRGGSGDGPPNLDRNSNVKPREQFLPAKYNVNTELQITVEPGSGGRITRDFELTE